MARSPGVRLALATALALAPGAARAQGGWRQWDVVLRDGTRLEANPLGAVGEDRFSLSAGGHGKREGSLARSRIDYLAAPATVGPRREPIPGVTLPPPPRGRVCRDLVVRWDGRRTSGRVSVAGVAWSAGVIRQRGVAIDLADVAYLKFADRSSPACAPKPVPAPPGKVIPGPFGFWWLHPMDRASREGLRPAASGPSSSPEGR